jgi:hypothetical protein
VYPLFFGWWNYFNYLNDSGPVLRLRTEVRLPNFVVSTAEILILHTYSVGILSGYVFTCCGAAVLHIGRFNSISSQAMALPVLDSFNNFSHPILDIHRSVPKVRPAVPNRVPVPG